MAKNIVALRGSERLRGWINGERIGEDARGAGKRQTERTKRQREWKARQDKAKV